MDGNKTVDVRTTPMTLDEQLQRVAAGDQAALRQIYVSEGARLYAIALRILRRPEEAADVVQEAFIQIWRNAGSFQPGLGSAAGWMTSIVRYRALDVARRHGRESLTDTIPEQVDDSPDPLAALEQHRAADGIRHCLSALEEKSRRAIVLAFVDGLSHGQVAEQLASPLGTVKSWIRRGLVNLKTCLGDDYPWETGMNN